jgi:integrase
VDFSYAGKRLWKSLRTRNWRQAEDFLRQLENDALAQSNRPAPLKAASGCPDPQCLSETIEAATMKFLADAESRDLSAATLGKYTLLFRTLRGFAQQRGLNFVADLSVDVVRDFRATLPYRGTTARKKIEELRTFFRFCQDSGWITSNPAKCIRPPKETSAPVEPFTDEELHRIRSACALYPDGSGRTHRAHAQRLRTLTELMMHTGLRIGDAVTLRRDRIVDGKLHIRTAKTGTYVWCPLPGPLVEQLHTVQGTSTQYFFWSGVSKPKSAVGDWQRALKRLFKLAGIVGGHAHRFRHTFAKNLLMARTPIETVAVLLGHRSPGITLKHYAAWVPERQEQLEATVARVWADIERSKTQQKEPVKSLKQHESAIQPLYGNGPGWLN